MTRRIPTFGARKIAQELAAENHALSLEIARLHGVVAAYGIEDAVTRTIALEDLADEITVQEARLRDLLDDVRATQSRLVSAADER